MTEFLTPTAAAKYLGYSELSLRKCHATLPVPAPVKINKRLMWRLEDCQAHISTRRRKSVKRGKPGKMETVESVSKFNKLAVDFLTGKYLPNEQAERVEAQKRNARTFGYSSLQTVSIIPDWIVE